jgi:AraC family transcriptional regulator, activator of mtrCDE
MRNRPMADVLGALLHHVRITTSRFGRIELGAPWGARVGSRATIALHHLLDGELWLEMDRQEIHVRRGDLVVLPHGTAYVMRYRPGAAVQDEATWQPSAGPASLSVRRRYGGDGALTVVLCAELSAAGAGRDLLMRALPAVVHVSADRPVRALGQLLDILRDEVRQPRRGTPFVAARLAELLLVQGILAELERPAARGSWRAGLADDRVARALDALYTAPEYPWSVVTLARAAGMGRTAFTDRFRELVGETPFTHLTRWRMEVAKTILREEPGRTLGEVAAAVGYGDEFAFGTAFRRVVGVPPGAYRTAGEAGDDPGAGTRG